MSHHAQQYAKDSPGQDAGMGASDLDALLFQPEGPAPFATTESLTSCAQYLEPMLRGEFAGLADTYDSDDTVMCFLCMMLPTGAWACIAAYLSVGPSPPQPPLDICIMCCACAA